MQKADVSMGMKAVALGLGLALVLAACSFRPLYGTSNEGNAARIGSEIKRNSRKAVPYAVYVCTSPPSAARFCFFLPQKTAPIRGSREGWARHFLSHAIPFIIEFVKRARPI